MTETTPVSIALETSCREGGLALGRGGRLLEAVAFDARRRHATQVVARMDELLTRHDLRPADLSEVYVSAGPGSFTGIRVGVTVARTLAQALGGVRCVRVPTAAAVAENARQMDWRRLAVVFDCRDELVYAVPFEREADTPRQAGEPVVAALPEFLAGCCKPLLLTGEGLGYHPVAAEGVDLAPQELWTPTAEGVWRVGRRMAEAGQFSEYHHLLPIYARRPEAVRLWEQRRTAHPQPTDNRAGRA